MDSSFLKRFCREKFRVGDSLALIGKSAAGKSTVVETLLSNFSANFSASLHHCKRVIIIYRALQPSYQRILALFPDSCEKIMSTSVDAEWLNPSYWSTVYTSPQDFSLLLLDDRMEELSAKDSMELKLLSSTLFVGAHHSSLIIICTLQVTSSFFESLSIT